MNAVVKPKTPTIRPHLAAPPEPRETRLRRLFNTLFGIDVRTVALFRIGIGLLIIADLITRGVDLQAHYTEAGVMPQVALSHYFSTHAVFSIHFLNGSPTAQVLLFCIAGLFALALTLGFQTRLAALVSWALLLSLQSRNPLVLTGGDNFFRVLVFWSLFLPLGAYWSLDRALSKTPVQVPQRIVSLGSAGLLLQVCIIYWFTALMKWGTTWHDNTAVYYALSVDQYAKPLAYALLPHRDLLQFLTFVTWRLEMFGPFLVLAASFSGPLRTLMVFVFIGFHMSLGLCMELGLFPFISACGWLPFLPSWFWEMLAKLWNRVPKLRISPPRSRYMDVFWNALLRLKPQPIRTKPHWLMQGLAGFFLVFVFLWNLRELDGKRYGVFLPTRLNWIAELTRLDQNWGMFAPNPMAEHGWLVIPAELKDGTEIDLLQEVSPVSWEKPALISATYENDRWRRYLMNLCASHYEGYRFYYTQYLYRQWSQVFTGDRQIRRISIYFVQQMALPGYKLSPWQRVPLYIADFPTN